MSWLSSGVMKPIAHACSQVAERGLKFVQTFVAALDRQAAAGRLPPLFKEAWTFSASVSLASTTVRIGPPPPTPTAQTPQPAPHKQASLPPLPSGIHRWAPTLLTMGPTRGKLTALVKLKSMQMCGDWADCLFHYTTIMQHASLRVGLKGRCLFI